MRIQSRTLIEKLELFSIYRLECRCFPHMLWVLLMRKGNFKIFQYHYCIYIGSFYAWLIRNLWKVCSFLRCELKVKYLFKVCFIIKAWRVKWKSFFEYCSNDNTLRIFLINISLVLNWSFNHLRIMFSQKWCDTHP